MVNTRTSVFEVMKINLLKFLLKNPLVTTAKQTRTAKAETDLGTEAEIEYKIDGEWIKQAQENG